MGATTRQNTILADPTIAAHAPTLVQAVRNVGHHQTRNRGTVGGSVSLGEPAAELPATAVALEAMMPRLLPASRQNSNEAGITRRMILDTPPETAVADQRGMAQRREHFATLEALRVPFLVIGGEADPLIPGSELEAMMEACAYAPYSRLLTLPGVGHLAPLEAPEEVAKALAELIQKGRIHA